MTDIHDIENTSLEAHVSLCAERYKQLETRLTNLEQRLDGIESTIKEIRDAVTKEKSTLDGRIIAAGGTVIATLVGAIGYLITHYVIK